MHPTLTPPPSGPYIASSPPGGEGPVGMVIIIMLAPNPAYLRAFRMEALSLSLIAASGVIYSIVGDCEIQRCDATFIIETELDAAQAQLVAATLQQTIAEHPLVPRVVGVTARVYANPKSTA